MEKVLAVEGHVLITVGTFTLNNRLVLIKEQNIGRLEGERRINICMSVRSRVYQGGVGLYNACTIHVYTWLYNTLVNSPLSSLFLPSSHLVNDLQ